MKRHELFAIYLKECPVIAILRGITPEEITGVADILAEAGIRLLEIPLNSPRALESIALAAKHCGNNMLVGAGTVLTVDDAQAVAAAGGEFIISPNTDPEVIRETVKLGLISMPGFFSPSEGFAAVKAGADYLKLFPAGQLGIGYIKDIQAVLKAPILAVGGVNPGNTAEFLQVCKGVGIGSALYKSGKSAEDIRRDAVAFVQAARA